MHNLLGWVGGKEEPWNLQFVMLMPLIPWTYFLKEGYTLKNCFTFVLNLYIDLSVKFWMLSRHVALNLVVWIWVQMWHFCPLFLSQLLLHLTPILTFMSFHFIHLWSVIAFKPLTLIRNSEPLVCDIHKHFFIFPFFTHSTQHENTKIYEVERVNNT